MLYYDYEQSTLRLLTALKMAGQDPLKAIQKLYYTYWKKSVA